MSETRHYRGTLKLIATGKEQMEEKAKEYLNSIGETELPSYHDSWVEFLEDTFYKEYVHLDDKLYVVEKEDVGEEDVFVASKTDNGYKFEVQYYDGGMSFDEAIEEAISNIEETL